MTGSVGALITAARKLSGLSQEAAARELGVDRRSLGEWERTGRVPTDRLGQLRELYGENFRVAEASASAEADDATTADERNGGQPLVIEYHGYRVEVYPKPGLSAEDLAEAEDSVMTAVIQTLRSLGRETAEGDSSA
jgi:transcriptional regulator with XRE-family HTH domain